MYLRTFSFPFSCTSELSFTVENITFSQSYVFTERFNQIYDLLLHHKCTSRFWRHLLDGLDDGDKPRIRLNPSSSHHTLCQPRSSAPGSAKRTPDDD